MNKATAGGGARHVVPHTVGDLLVHPARQLHQLLFQRLPPGRNPVVENLSLVLFYDLMLELARYRHN